MKIHTGAAKIVELGEGLALMVAPLIGGGEERVGVRNDVILKFSHGLDTLSLNHLINSSILLTAWLQKHMSLFYFQLPYLVI